MKDYELRFLIKPLRGLGLSGNEISFFLGLWTYRNHKTGKWTPSLKRMEQEIGWTKKTLRKWLQRLVDLDLIRRERRNRKGIPGGRLYHYQPGDSLLEILILIEKPLSGPLCHNGTDRISKVLLQRMGYTKSTTVMGYTKSTTENNNKKTAETVAAPEAAAAKSPPSEEDKQGKKQKRVDKDQLALPEWESQPYPDECVTRPTGAARDRLEKLGLLNRVERERKEAKEQGKLPTKPRSRDEILAMGKKLLEQEKNAVPTIVLGNDFIIDEHAIGTHTWQGQWEVTLAKFHMSHGNLVLTPPKTNGKLLAAGAA